MPQLTRAARYQALSWRWRKWAYQAKVLKIWEQSNKTAVLHNGGYHRLGTFLWWRQAAAPSRFQVSVAYFVARKRCARHHSSGEMGMSTSSTPNVAPNP